MEKVEASGNLYHKFCFRCSICKGVLRIGNYNYHHKTLFCQVHYKQLVFIKGNMEEGFGLETWAQAWAKKNPGPGV